MLAIRLSRVGKKNSAYFRVVVMDKQKSAKGRAIEVLGSVNPHKKEITLKNERILYWIGVGAQPSDRVYNILVSKEVIEGKKRPKKIKKSKKEAGGEETEVKPAIKEDPSTPETNSVAQDDNNGVNVETQHAASNEKVEEETEDSHTPSFANALAGKPVAEGDHPSQEGASSEKKEIETPAEAKEEPKEAKKTEEQKDEVLKQVQDDKNEEKVKKETKKNEKVAK